MNTEVFDMNKMYRFNKELSNGGKWTELCDGLIVNANNEYIGTVKVNGEEYIIFPKWCDEIAIECTSTEKGNVYKENIKNLIEDVYKRQFYNMKESSSMKIKNLPQTLEGFFGKDDSFYKFKKGYTYVFDIMNVPNESLEGWMFKIDENKALTRVNEHKAIVEDCDGVVHEIPRIFATAIETFENGKNYELAWDLIPIQKRLLKKYKPLELCDGMIVDPVNQFEATIKYEGEEYIIDREWCLEVDEMEF